MSKADISLEDLKVGMFVTGLDIAWIDSPFLRHSLLIKNDADITKLRQCGVKVVTIDLTKSKVQPTPKQSRPAKTKSSDMKQSISVSEPEAELKPESLINPETEANPETETNAETESKRVSLSQEMAEASKLHKQLTSLTRTVFDNLNKGVPADLSSLDQLIVRTISSLTRNNQALFALLHMQRKAGELYEHAFSVFNLSLALAHSLKLSEQEQKTLGYAALIHDAGWLKLPMQLLGKGRAYSEVEKKLVNQHVQLTLNMMEHAEGVTEEVIKLVSLHQELADGTGYPNSIAVKDNSVWAILAVADRYDERVNQLMDQPGQVPNKALKLLFEEAREGKLELKVVQSLISLLGVYPIGSAVALSTGEKALVIECLRGKPSQPIVRIYYDKKGVLLPKSITLDLSQQNAEEEISIKQVLDPRESGVDPADCLNIDLKEISKAQHG